MYAFVLYIDDHPYAPKSTLSMHTVTVCFHLAAGGCLPALLRCCVTPLLLAPLLLAPLLLAPLLLAPLLLLCNMARVTCQCTSTSTSASTCTTQANMARVNVTQIA